MQEARCLTLARVPNDSTSSDMRRSVLDCDVFATRTVSCASGRRHVNGITAVERGRESAHIMTVQQAGRGHRQDLLPPELPNARPRHPAGARMTHTQHQLQLHDSHGLARTHLSR